MTAMTAADVVAALALAPHPEGGFYRETFRDAGPAPATAISAAMSGAATSPSASDRAVSTAIFFLLPEGVLSRWHRVDAAEVWHWYAGAPLVLSVAAGEAVRDIALGVDLAAGQRPQAVVPPLAWQQARSLGAWTLVGCTVAPGFLFDRFEIAPGDAPPRGD